MPIAFHLTQDPILGEVSPAIGGVKPTTGYSTIGVAYGVAENQRAEVLMTEEYLRQLTAGGGKPGQGYPAVMTPELAVRRLTPLECERLQGFPDGWTDGQADSHRYRQLGNAVAVPVVAWLGKRIMAVETMQEALR